MRLDEAEEEREMRQEGPCPGAGPVPFSPPLPLLLLRVCLCAVCRCVGVYMAWVSAVRVVV